jgi:integrase
VVLERVKPIMARRTQSTRRSPQKGGTVRQLPSGRYRASYRSGGRAFAAPNTFATAEEAWAWLHGERGDRARGTWVDPHLGQVTVAQFSDSWLASHSGLSDRTRAAYRRILDRDILPMLGDIALADLTRDRCRTWYTNLLTEAADSARRRCAIVPVTTTPARDWAQKNGYTVARTGRLPAQVTAAWNEAGRPAPAPVQNAAPTDAGRSTAVKAYSLLRSILNVAEDDGLLPRNPCRIKGAGQLHSRERGTASPDEVARLASLMPRSLSAAVTLAAWSSIRQGELFALARRHLDLEAGTVRVERALKRVPGEPVTFGAPKTAKSRRTVSLPQFVVDALRAHLDEFTPPDPDALVFATSAGSPVDHNNLNRAFRRARTAISREDLAWHDLRHTGATLAYQAGASVPEVQRRLGHTTMRAASIYAHAADGFDRFLADRLDALYSASATGTARLHAV